MSAWRPMCDEAKKLDFVLLYMPDAREPKVCVASWTEWENEIGDANWTDAWTDQEIDTEPTHWRPMPEDPKV